MTATNDVHSLRASKGKRPGADEARRIRANSALLQKLVAGKCNLNPVFVAIAPGAKRPHRDAFALKIAGDCLAPRVKNGQTVIVEPILPQPGEIAIIWFKGEAMASAKILRTPITYGYPHNPGSNVAFPLEIEQTNPPKRWRVWLSAVEAVGRVHSVVAEADAHDRAVQS